jgi:hypothetical protein
VVKVFELMMEQRRLQFGHPMILSKNRGVIVPGGDAIVGADGAQVAESLGQRRDTRVTCYHHAPLARRHLLALLEAEYPGDASGARCHASAPCTKPLAGVLDQRHAEACQLVSRRPNVDGVALDMDRDNATDTWVQAPPEIVHVDAELRSDVERLRDRTSRRDRSRSRDERKGWYEHALSRPDARHRDGM